MKILMMECNEEELKANKTIVESICDAISNFTTALCGVELNSEMLARYNRFKDDQEAADEEQ